MRRPRSCRSRFRSWHRAQARCELLDSSPYLKAPASDREASARSVSRSRLLHAATEGAFKRPALEYAQPSAQAPPIEQASMFSVHQGTIPAFMKSLRACARSQDDRDRHGGRSTSRPRTTFRSSARPTSHDRLRSPLLASPIAGSRAMPTRSTPTTARDGVLHPIRSAADGPASRAREDPAPRSYLEHAGVAPQVVERSLSDAGGKDVVSSALFRALGEQSRSSSVLRSTWLQARPQEITRTGMLRAD